MTALLQAAQAAVLSLNLLSCTVLVRRAHFAWQADNRNGVLHGGRASGSSRI